MSDAAPGAPTLELQAVERTYKTAAGGLTVLNGASLSVGRGELVGLVAPSGAGKSTLLHVAGLLERPDGGDVALQGEGCNRLTDRQRTLLRRSRVGFVYQFHHLLPEFSALENVTLPQMIAGKAKRAARQEAARLLERVGLGPRMSHRPARLSGGEQQRVAIARAVVNRPALLLADEPTGNLDPTTSETVFDLLVQLVREEGMAALIATHNLTLARRMDRVLTFREGTVTGFEG
ncbi:MAG: ABC transporter ATP-binding protein [Marivibrio sp.]|uniref:ABC transporter ATP-binding protein n=1 Tax=Marivibrio sp. TaxID=2039719 RepID=UPI0032ED520A